MRQYSIVCTVALLTAGLSGCVPQATDSGESADLISSVASISANPTQDGGDSGGSEPASTASSFSGSVAAGGQYQLYEIGQAARGDAWEIVPDGTLTSPFVVVLLDAEYNLLMRTYMSYNGSLRHTMRAGSDLVYLGVMSPVNGRGGGFGFKAYHTADQSVPNTRRQVVYLNFGSGRNVQVHTRDPISFAPFDGSMIGDAYDGFTDEMKNVIVEEMRADYAGYNIAIYSSDDGPAPEEIHSTIHFGGSESGLLGLADNVDNYNQNLSQNALIYIENFSPYWTMQLTPEEMAVMIANVGSHELGHLLGLYHTQDPDDIMDTTGSAWDLADNQSFIRGRLESSVFAIGWEDCPELLSQTLGKTGGSTAKSLAWRKSDTYREIRQIALEEISHSCGTCQCLDHE